MIQKILLFKTHLGTPQNYYFQRLPTIQNNKDVVYNLKNMEKIQISTILKALTCSNWDAHFLIKETYAFYEGNMDLYEKINRYLKAGSSIVFTRKTFVDQTYIRDSSNCLHRNSWI